MIQGTTPTHTFNVGIDTGNIDALRITYKQGSNIILTKEKGDCTLGEKQITCKLSQEETLRFQSNVDVRMQIRIRTNDGEAIASKIFKAPVYAVLDKVVI